MNSLAQYTQARNNLNSWYRLFSIVMLLAGVGMIPAAVCLYLSPGILTILLAPGLAGIAAFSAIARLMTGTEIDKLALASAQQFEHEEAKIDRELAEADPALGVILRVDER